MVPASFKKILMAALLAAITISARAQFNSMGSERGSLKWSQIETPDFRIVYPEGMDSVAIHYGTLLQQYRTDVGRSAGFLPNQYWVSPMPVVMHPFTGYANGAVIETPRRMELFTMPDAYGMVAPMPWENNLAIHENRHVAQVQFAYSDFWGWFYELTGEALSMYTVALYANMAMLEGDAVATETALTNSGRGRTADFLAYYRMAFDQGDTRNWYRWRYGSLNKYTPDHYALGYMTVAGARAAYDAPMFMAEYLRRLSRPWGINAVNGTMKAYSGKNIRKAWPEIVATFKDEWDKEDEARGPFQEMDLLTSEKRGYTSFRGAVAVSENRRIMAIRAGLNRDPQLVEINSKGKVTAIRPFDSDSRLTYSELTKNIYWSAVVPDPRWDMEQDSRIQMMDIRTSKVKDFTKEGRYVNPAVSPDGTLLAAIEYPIEGGSKAVVFDIQTGEVIKSIKAQNGLQLTEAAFWDDKLILTGISEGGSGIYETDFNSIGQLMAPTPAKIRNLVSRPDGIYFSSDRGGTNEIYLFSPGSRSLTRKTNTKYGATEPFFLGEEMYFRALQPHGQFIAKADYCSVPTDPSAVHQYAIADILSAQEDSVQIATAEYFPENPVEISAPREYSKFGNLFHIHSWLPFYYNYDGFKASYSDYLFDKVSLGAIAFYQNLSSTASGTLGISAHNNPFNNKKMSFGFHGRMHYTGLYPVMDFALDIGDRPSAIFQNYYDIDRDSLFLNATQDQDERIKRFPLYMGGKATISLPLSFSKGGWTTAIRPAVSLQASSDLYHFPARRVYYVTATDSYADAGDNLNPGVASSMTASAGFSWATQVAKAPSQVMPRQGYGGDLFATTNLISTVLYEDLYTYSPGFFPGQGFKLTQKYQFSPVSRITANSGWPTQAQNLAPRGYEDTNLGLNLNRYCTHQAMVSADYVIPAFSMETAITPYIYIRNMEFAPFADFTAVQFMVDDKLPQGRQYFYSAGMDINFHFERFLVVSGSVTMGIRLAYNAASEKDWMESLGIDEPFHIGFVFNAGL